VVFLDGYAEDGTTRMRDRQWWRSTIIYEIYLRSFHDDNGDGVGDLPGVIHRLGYLRELGVGAFWLTPFYPSPMVDLGYDICDFTGVDPMYGTLRDFDDLVRQTHRFGLRIILDLVANHTSDQHPWFLDARPHRNSEKRDWYIWRDPVAQGDPPNNWISVFGGSAWTFDKFSGQYYLHSFSPQQPDLNWRNDGVREAMSDVMRFWLDRGVDGFRIDATERLIKDDRFRDNPPNPDFQPGDAPDDALKQVFTLDQPRVHDIYRDMRQVVDAYEDRVLVGELYIPLERVITYYGSRLDELHFPLNLRLMLQPWTTEAVGSLIRRYEHLLPEGAWPNWTLGNHDMPRVASRTGLRQARVAAMLLLTLRGTPIIYYGDELGMQDLEMASEDMLDLREKNDPGVGLGRDPVRSPMQWDSSEGAGFTRTTPWLPVQPNATELNVAAESKDPLSMLTLYRRLIALRAEEPALVSGQLTFLLSRDDLLAYVRETPERSLLIVLNFGEDPLVAELPERASAARVVLSTHLDRDDEIIDGIISLRGDEGLVAVLGPQDAT
jgi:alpha-glucosidase